MSSNGVYGRFSVKEAYVFPLLTDDTTSGLTYGPGKKIQGIQSITVSRNRAQVPLPGDDTILEVESSLESVEIEVEYAKNSHDMLEVIEGGEKTDSGSAPNDVSEYVLYGDSSPSGYFKIEARCAKTGKTGADVLRTIYKVNASTIEDGMANKEWATQSFSAQAVATTVTGVSTDTDDRIFADKERNSGVAGAIVATQDTMVPTVATTPADAATGVVVSDNILMDFNELMDLSTLNRHNILLFKASDGATVTFTDADLSYNESTHVLTLNPPSDLAAATAYILVLTSNIKDAAGNRLAETRVNFTTA